jgi:putative ABC transport system ATP-binding protein
MPLAAKKNAVDESSFIELRNVSKIYPGGSACTALRDVNLSIARGKFTAILGRSGSGKSTMLNLIAGIDRPTHGEIVIDGTAVHALSERALTQWRGRSVGIVFQFFQLLPTLTAIENVMLPMDFCRRWPKHEQRKRAHQLLDRLGVVDHSEKLPSALSGGQQQRVAIARALANAPELLLADEPTGNLDSTNAATLLAVFDELVRNGQTVVVVTHDDAVVRHAQRSVTLVDGSVDHD